MLPRCYTATLIRTRPKPRGKCSPARVRNYLITDPKELFLVCRQKDLENSMNDTCVWALLSISNGLPMKIILPCNSTFAFCSNFSHNRVPSIETLWTSSSAGMHTSEGMSPAENLRDRSLLNFSFVAEDPSTVK